mmetsp:Transcript_9660/g.12627  ORF Transcript_9660/g.12627 Transcript_9660/m.12627 type:complete len:503 (-) Transcript_9660:262-1770(-)|eukprot:CAMPEP_0184023882 /NCGR_PEP_ID=MMETSP0954-20121128/11673_1 /TAXON_ID=627963 /ORGANISM="Aplanochytrium sp, Strain PBS07" /LENGTH=502 /DNA_ID=CAMNT_0026306947 /DNA_START=61 /DNA_END=1569 /DNA_ORIENTATION=+
MSASNRDLSGECWYTECLSIIIFGASGDLAKKKTYPALFELFLEEQLPKERTVICGYARSKKTDEELREHLKPFLKGNEDDINSFLSLCIYRYGGYDDEEAISAMSSAVTSSYSQENIKTENRVFYFALPPTVFVATATSVKKSALTTSGFNRLIVEKPFGHDTESALQLSRDLGALYSEDHLYRIDHYLGKEIVQNMLALRFSNMMFEPIWNREHIKSVTFTFKEDIGTQGRGGYFDKSGIIRDIMQNHLMQVLSLVAMEPPVRVAGTDDYSNYVRDEKVKLLKSIQPWTLENTVLGQYVANGKTPGYLDDPTVPEGSICPTYAAVVMYIKNRRWDGVPFIMKAGKALNERKAEVRIQFHKPPGSDFMFGCHEVLHNELVMRLQPKEAIYVKTNVKEPGLHTNLITTELDLSYHDRFVNLKNPSAYSRLLLEVLRGKQATFVRDDELLAAWEIVTPLLKEIESKKVEPNLYKFGARGPKEADTLIKNAGYVYDSTYEWKQQ